MSKLGFRTVVYHGDVQLGEIDLVSVKGQTFRFPNDEIRIRHVSQRSERCPPLSVLQTISPFSVRCKLESSNPNEHVHLINLHSSCFHELKTAVVVLGDEEIHLVAMPSRQKKFPCFWCFAVPCGLYDVCLGMLNLRCLSIVFDLDETLIVANTMKSFEDRIETLRSWIVREIDPIRASGMTAEMRRYADDRALLKQYAETDSVTDNGKVFNVELEEVFPLLESEEKLVRPVVRLPERNIVLTRINPEIRDTSVLVRLRPAWEDLRSYLTAKGRKRFEVYVCTMAERNYALEMWRLLDPESRLISLKNLMERVTCVKSGSRKSLLNVFQGGNCHPKMAMVIDDRLKVWEDKDQPRVHVVPPFTPYYAPQAETANAVPVLCVARNVACNVRGGFFKEFDENLLRKIYEVHHEDEVVSLPSAPDVSNYLMSEDGSFGPNGNINAPINEGMHGPEVAQHLNHMGENYGADFATQSRKNNLERRFEVSHPVTNLPNILNPPSLRTVLPSEKPSLLGAPFRRDISSSEPDSDKKRFLIVNPSQDTRYRGSGDPPLLTRIPSQLPNSSVQPQGGWLIEEDSSKEDLTKRHLGVAQDSNSLKVDKQQARKNLPYHGILGSTRAGLGSHVSEVKGEEGYPGTEAQRQNPPVASQPSDIGVSPRQVSFNGRDLPNDCVKINNLQASPSIGVLHEIGRRCSSKVEFKSTLSTSKDFQFSIEVFFTGERIGVGVGKTRKDAQRQAAEDALRKLADKYLQAVGPCSGAEDMDSDKMPPRSENGFLWDDSELEEQPADDGLRKDNNSKARSDVSVDEENQHLSKGINSSR